MELAWNGPGSVTSNPVKGAEISFGSTQPLVLGRIARTDMRRQEFPVFASARSIAHSILPWEADLGYGLAAPCCFQLQPRRQLTAFPEQEVE